MPFDANKIADTIIALSLERGSEITNLKLQKLLYYAQAWNLAFTGKPLFIESVEAWVHGPVVPTVFRRFRDYRWRTINSPVVQCEDDSVRKLAAAVLDAYGKFDATQLERLTHHESPWREARHGLDPDESSRAIIPHSAMRDYYGKRIATADGG